jgi:hypothetical protein
MFSYLWIIYRFGSRTISNTEIGDRENAIRKAEQGTQSKVGGIGDCPEDKDQGHHCHTGKQDQQFRRTARSRSKVIFPLCLFSPTSRENTVFTVSFPNDFLTSGTVLRF